MPLITRWGLGSLPWPWVGSVTALNNRIWQKPCCVLRNYWHMFPVSYSASHHPTPWSDWMKRLWDSLERERAHLFSALMKALMMYMKPFWALQTRTQANDPETLAWRSEEQKTLPAEPCPNSWHTKPWHVLGCICLKPLNFEATMDNQNGSFFISLYNPH